MEGNYSLTLIVDLIGFILHVYEMSYKRFIIINYYFIITNNLPNNINSIWLMKVIQISSGIFETFWRFRWFIELTIILYRYRMTFFTEYWKRLVKRVSG